MPTARLRVRGVFDGEKVIPREPLNLPPDTEVEIVVPEREITYAERYLGLPRIEVKGPGPAASEIAIEERGPR